MPTEERTPASNARPDASGHPTAAPAVSFIVPLFNCLALTQAMVRSLEATLPRGLPHEIILIDDGSTDGTREWLATLQPPFRTILNERNSGYAITNNRAAAAARGARLVLLNNDLVLLPGWFEALVAVHRSLGSRAGLVGNIQLDARTGAIDHTGIIFNLKAKPEHDRTLPARRLFWLPRRLRIVPAVTAACVMISADLWRQLGGFDEGYVNGGEDVDLCFRARAAGRRNAVALRSVVRHHVSSSAGRKQRDEANSARLARRWRNEFVACAAPAWCRDYAEAILPEPRGFEPGFALRVWLHGHGLTRSAPREAVSALNEALELEFVRWRAMLGDVL